VVESFVNDGVEGLRAHETLFDKGASAVLRRGIRESLGTGRNKIRRKTREGNS